MDYTDDGCKYLIIFNYNGENSDSELCYLYNDLELFNSKRKTNKHISLLENSDTVVPGIKIVLSSDGKYKILKELEVQNEFGEFHKCILTATSILTTASNSFLAIVTLNNGKEGIYDFSKEKFVTPLFDKINYWNRLESEIDKGVYETTTYVYDEESNYESEIIGYIYGDGAFASPLLDLSSETYYDPLENDFNYDSLIELSRLKLNSMYKKRKNNAKRLIKNVK